MISENEAIAQLLFLSLMWAINTYVYYRFGQGRGYLKGYKEGALYAIEYIKKTITEAKEKP